MHAQKQKTAQFFFHGQNGQWYGFRPPAPYDDENHVSQHGCQILQLITSHELIASHASVLIHTCQNNVSADQFSMTIMQAHGQVTYFLNQTTDQELGSIKGSRAQANSTCCNQGPVVRKVDNADSGQRGLVCERVSTGWRYPPFKEPGPPKIES